MILIVEDDFTQNNVLAGFLKKEGYEVNQAFSLAEARALFHSNIKLIVLDLNLPDGNGFDFLQEIRGKSKVPVIVLTALDDELTQLNAFDLQADEYVDKPVSPLIMTKRIQAFMNRFYPEGETDRTFICNFEFDFSNYTVTKEGGEVITLTATEFNIIKVLYTHKKMTLTREAIIESIWGYDFRHDVRILDPHVANIRKKLCPEIIITIKGIGYRIGG